MIPKEREREAAGVTTSQLTDGGVEGHRKLPAPRPQTAARSTFIMMMKMMKMIITQIQCLFSNQENTAMSFSVFSPESRLQVQKILTMRRLFIDY